ncbi:hypothetical protein AGMMS5026_03550 [Endomicrobiia bacterium]|nr:hypothetical protein AGMMS49523_04850 [Endomicrobiia bacterium]GHT13694.1 hypothetical protein AGMMS49571_07900 [Endomicrobiia bacterium]GHT19066.1 hypothetical protein AGMMS49929_01970 [Endomicrobiia bacterium]GHT28495.1 hypothetical protein AGMMS49995_09420 [Endomicrobiia bacterium]GHT30143.1 hypothetical protein AGMMS5026_03550 [Endomicrobiia bacterium]
MLLMVCAGCGRSKNDMLRGAAIGYAFGTYKTVNSQEMYDAFKDVSFEETAISIIMTLCKPCEAKKELLELFDIYKSSLQFVQIDPTSIKTKDKKIKG